MLLHVKSSSKVTDTVNIKSKTWYQWNLPSPSTFKESDKDNSRSHTDFQLAFRQHRQLWTKITRSCVIYTWTDCATGNNVKQMTLWHCCPDRRLCSHLCFKLNTEQQKKLRAQIYKSKQFGNYNQEKNWKIDSLLCIFIKHYCTPGYTKLGLSSWNFFLVKWHNILKHNLCFQKKITVGLNN